MLAHSLSAQLVHLEAARLLIERGADRGPDPANGWSRPGGMARDGLAETRQALSALRGRDGSGGGLPAGAGRRADGAEIDGDG